MLGFGGVPPVRIIPAMHVGAFESGSHGAIRASSRSSLVLGVISSVSRVIYSIACRGGIAPITILPTVLPIPCSPLISSPWMSSSSSSMVGLERTGR